MARIALFDRLSGHLDNFETYHENFVEQVGEEFSEAGLDLSEILKVAVNRGPLNQALGAARNRLAEISVLVNGTEKQKGLEAQIEELGHSMARLRTELGARQREYQAYLGELQQWQARRALIVGTVEKPDTIEYLKARIEAIEKTLPNEYGSYKDQRTLLVREIHEELLKIRGVYQELYKPVQDMVAASSAFTKEPLELDFADFLSPSRFEDDFLEYIHRNRVGTFYGDEESKKAVQRLVDARDFNLTADVVAFLEDLMNALMFVDRSGQKIGVAVQSQLKDLRTQRESKICMSSCSVLNIWNHVTP